MDDTTVRFVGITRNKLALNGLRKIRHRRTDRARIASSRISPDTRNVLGGAALAMVLAALDQNIVNTALPRMVSELGGMAHLSWVVTAFMLTATISAPLYGRLSDIYGRRTMFFVCIILFLSASLLCGAARSMAQIIGFRALQGLGAGGLMVLAQAVVADVVPPRERPRYQGLFSGALALSSVAGPLLGGIITSALSWRWVFYVNLPVGALALVMIAAGLQKTQVSQARSIDYTGAVLLAGTTTALLLLLAWGGRQFPWLSPQAAGLLAAAAIFGVMLVWQERSSREPLIRLGLFRNRIYARGVMVSGMMAFAMLGSAVFLPLYFQVVLGMDPAAAGAMMLPQVVGMLLTSIIGGRIVSHLGRNKAFLLAGVGLEAAALASLALLAFVGAPAPAFLFSMGALGMGMGMGMPNLTTAVQNAVAHSELGAATGSMNFVRSLGGALGVATSGAITSSRLATTQIGNTTTPRSGILADTAVHALSRSTPAQQAALADAYRTALSGCFLLSCVVMTAAFVLVLGLPELALRGDAIGPSRDSLEA